MVSWYIVIEGWSFIRIKKYCVFLSKVFIVSWGGDIGKFFSIVKVMLKYCMVVLKFLWWNFDFFCI